MTLEKAGRTTFPTRRKSDEEGVDRLFKEEADARTKLVSKRKQNGDGRLGDRFIFPRRRDGRADEALATFFFFWFQISETSLFQHCLQLNMLRGR